jgi:hypothetical protein
MSQRNTSESRDEQASLTYGRYEGEQEYAHQHNEAPDAQLLREGPGEKVYLLPRDNTNLYRLLTFVIAMVALRITKMPQQFLRILVIDAGVIGNVYTTRLQEAGYTVTLLAREQHAADLRTNGIILQGIST